MRARKSHNIGPGIILKHANYQHNTIPTSEMAGVEQRTFTATAGSKDNLFLPLQRERDNRVLTREDSFTIKSVPSFEHEF